MKQVARWGYAVRTCSRIWTMVSRVDSVSTLINCSTTPIITKFISPYDAIATPVVTTNCDLFTPGVSASLPSLISSHAAHR